MKTLKKSLALVLVLVMSFAIVACNKDDKKDAKTTTTDKVTESSDEVKDADEKEESKADEKEESKADEDADAEEESEKKDN